MKILTIVLLILLDFITKRIIFNFIELNDFISIAPFIDIAHIHNYGIAFGLFAGILPLWFITLSSFIILIFLILWMLKIKNELERWGLLFIIAGAISNIVDRLINNYVIDFIHLNYEDYYWPIFNFADIYISLGALILIIENYKLFKTRLKEKK